MAEVDQAPLIDLSHVQLMDLLRGVDADISEPLHRAVARTIHDLHDPNAVISAFGSYAAR